MNKPESILEDEGALDDPVLEDRDEFICAADAAAPAAALTSTGLNRRRISTQPVPPVRPVQPAAPAVEVAPPREADIVEYWSGLRNGRKYPAVGDLDADQIVAAWPNSILLTRSPGEKGMRASALYKPLAGGGNCQQTAGLRVDFAPKVVEWVLSLAENTVRSGLPLADRELFELPDGAVRYTACTLPLSDDQINVDHVLCYVRAAA